MMRSQSDPDTCARLEAIIRPIVEGQIRGFLKEHPPIVEAVDWYKPRKDKAVTFTNSLAKRIVRDLTCGITAARIGAVFLASESERRQPSFVARRLRRARPVWNRSAERGGAT